MGRYEAADWDPPAIDGVPRSHRRRGRYWAYVPDPLAQQTPLALPGPVVERVAEAAAAMTAASRVAGTTDLDSPTSLALRSEAVASSVIEGLQVSARSVALADFTGHGSSAALEVARNARLMRSATHDMVVSDRVDLDDILALQAHLVPHLPGLRQEQVWIGGANPLVAGYVPPVHQRIPALMADLLAYLNDPQDTPVVAAAVIHAQFETIHPFRDGNGRLGRALTHTLLTRAHSSTALVPFSRIFASRKAVYIEGLVAWRTDDSPRTGGSGDRRLQWIEVFADAVIESAALAEQLARRLADITRGHHERLSESRRRQGGRQPRRGSTVLRLLDDVAAYPIDTAARAAHRLSVSTVAARDALEELASVGVYRTTKIDKGKTVSYVANDILALADLTVVGDPGTPARNERTPRHSVCGYPIPRTGGRCTEHPGHDGIHHRRA